MEQARPSEEKRKRGNFVLATCNYVYEYLVRTSECPIGNGTVRFNNFMIILDGVQVCPMHLGIP